VSPLPFEDSVGSTFPSAFGSYRVLHQIGSGVLGPVFRTYEPQVDRLVAVKAFKLDLVPEDVARLADALRRLAANPSTHPGIVRVLDAGLEGTSPFVAMEYASGESLDVAMRDLGQGLGRVLPVLIDIARAVDAAWAEGRGHGALHPRDVIVSPGTADTRITGFGIISALESIGARPPARRPYTAPERVAGEPWDIRADVYSVGAIAHELLTGRRPLGSGEQDGTLAAELTPEQRVNLRRVVGAALAEQPKDRYENATAFVSALEAIARGEGAILPAPAIAPAAPVPNQTAVAEKAATPEKTSVPHKPAVTDAGAVPDRAAVADKAAPKRAPAPAHQSPQTWHPSAPDAPRPDLVARAKQPRPAPPRPASETPKAPDRSRSVLGLTDAATPTPPIPLPPVDVEPSSQPELEFPSERRVPQESAALIVPPRAPVPVPPAAAPVRLAPTPVPPAPPAPPALAVPTAPVAQAPVSLPPAGNARISTFGLSGASQPIFTTRTAPADSPSPFPWMAIAAVAVACLLVGTAIGYAVGTRRVATVMSRVAMTPPGSRATTDVPIATEPGQKPAAPEAQPASPLAAGADPEERPAPSPQPPASRVSDVRGRIVVRSTPPGAIVRVNGRLHGETPITVRDLALGAHTLQVARPGYVPRTEKVTLTRTAASQTVTVQLEAGVDAANPSASKGSIFVDSRPRGARVTVDGRDAGVTPVQIPEMMPGRHAVSIELTGYKTISTNVVVAPKTPAKLAVTLEQIR
jgi:serine/threonine protein kinase